MCVLETHIERVLVLEGQSTDHTHPYASRQTGQWRAEEGGGGGDRRECVQQEPMEVELEGGDGQRRRGRGRGWDLRGGE